MGRTESTEVANQGMAQSSEDQANAQQALSSTQSSVNNYSNQLNNFLRFGRQTYGANGEYMRDQNTLATGTAKAGSDQIAGNLALNAMRTGENTSGYAGTIAASRNQAEQNLTQQLAGADANRLQQLTAVNQYGVQASALPAEINSSLYGTSTGGSGNQLSSAANAAKTPGFWDTFAPALAGAAGQVASGFTPQGGKGGCWIAAAVYDGWDDPRDNSGSRLAETRNLQRSGRGACSWRSTCGSERRLQSR